jgi:hypothetical protein
MYQYNDAMRQIAHDRGEQLRRSAARPRRARRSTRKRLYALAAAVVRH